MKRIFGKIFTLLVLLSAGPSYADIGWYGDSPGRITLEGEEHGDIILENEAVTIALKSGGFKSRSVDVKGRFEFYNSGRGTHVMMAYPLCDDKLPIPLYDDNWANDFLTERGISEEHPINYRVLSRKGLATAGFRSGFDSQIKDYRDIAIKVDGGEPLVEFVLRYELEERFIKTDRYVRWPVKFAAGETKRVEIAFESPYERKGGYGASWYHYNFEYPLYTGRTWAGPIGKGTITVVYEEDTIRGPIFFQSPGCPTAEVKSEGGNTEIKWSFHNLEPRPNAVIKIVKGAPDHFLPPTDVQFCRELGLEVDGEPGITLTPNVPLKTDPATGASNVDVNSVIPQHTPLAAKSSRGEWWYVKLNDGTEGWLRWREVDADTGEEKLNAAFAYYLTE